MLDRIDFGGSKQTATGRLNVANGWTEIVPLRVARHSFLVFYDSRHGLLSVQEVGDRNDDLVSRFETTLHTGYTHVLSYREASAGFALMYGAGTGLMAIQRFGRSDDGIVDHERTWTSSQQAGWTHLSILEAQGERHLLGYDAVTGDAYLWRNLPAGNGLEEGSELSLLPGWTALTPYYSGGQAYLLLYRARDGRTEKRRLSGGGALVLVAEEQLIEGFR